MAAAIPFAIAAVAAIGALSKAETEARNAERQAAGFDYNAEVSRQQARSAYSESTAAQLEARRRARELAGRNRAVAAQSGVGFGGSTADVLEQSETLAELDALNIAYEGQMRARGFLTQATLDAYNASTARSNAKATRRQGVFNAVTAGFAGYSAAGGSFGSPAPKTTITGTGGSGYSLSGNYASSVGMRPYGGLGLRYN